MQQALRRAAIYCRISQDREGAGLGVDRQRTDCETLAAKLGWDVVAIHADNDISAYSGRTRPGYRALLADLQAGRADAVLAWHTDRLHRSPRELEEYVDVCERHHVVTQTVQAGELDLATPSGRAIARTLGAWARFESEHKAERVRRKHEQAARDGLWRGGSRPFGWQLTGDGSAALDDSEADVIRTVCHDILSGVTLGSIVTRLNDAGVTTSTGRPWTYTGLRQVLLRARNAGLSQLRGEVVGPAVWPAIVTEDVWRSVCSVLTDPGRRRSQDNRVRHLLAGLAVCGGTPDGVECGTPLKSAVSDSHNARGRWRRTIYRCPTKGTGHVYRTAEPLDEYVTLVILERVSRPDAIDVLRPAPRGPSLPRLRAEATALRQRLTDAADRFADGEITATQLSRITDRVMARLGEVEADLSRAAAIPMLGAFTGSRPAAEVWEGLAIERRRALVAALMRVVVLPVGRGVKGLDPGTIDIRWVGPREA